MGQRTESERPDLLFVRPADFARRCENHVQPTRPVGDGSSRGARHGAETETGVSFAGAESFSRSAKLKQAQPYLFLTIGTWGGASSSFLSFVVIQRCNAGGSADCSMGRS